MKDLFTEGKENGANGLPKNISAGCWLPCRGKRSVQLWLFRESVLGLQSGRNGVVRQRHRIDTSYGTNTIQIYLSCDLPLENVAVCCIFFQETCLILEHAEDLPILLGVTEQRRKTTLQFAAYHHHFKSSSSLRDLEWTEVVWNRETVKESKKL